MSFVPDSDDTALVAANAMVRVVRPGWAPGPPLPAGYPDSGTVGPAEPELSDGLAHADGEARAIGGQRGILERAHPLRRVRYLRPLARNPDQRRLREIHGAERVQRRSGRRHGKAHRSYAVGNGDRPGGDGHATEVEANGEESTLAAGVQQMTRWRIPHSGCVWNQQPDGVGVHVIYVGRRTAGTVPRAPGEQEAAAPGKSGQ